ncbi:hypothetical protein [Flavobacterium sp. WC2509]|uniref:hypothetical protein n=1 Tax=Flavobacterium sp. WC2509 TaxID=3461406 RepID=UPI004044ADD4
MKLEFTNWNIKILAKKTPLWLKLLNGINLIPILVWPIIFLFSFFLLDNPNIIIALGSVILINSYPFVLIGSLTLSFKLYEKNKIILSIIVPLSITFILIRILMNFFNISI